MKRYRIHKVGFSDLARTVAYIVEDTAAMFNSTIDVFSESEHGLEAKRLALKRRDEMNAREARV